METVRHKEERISIRLTADQKSVIGAAAEALGISISSFVLLIVLEAANKIAEQQNQIRLNERDWNMFTSFISDDTEPTHAAINAAARYRGLKPL